MPREHEFPKSVKVAAFRRANGRCELCTAPLFPGRYRYDHRTPIAFGGLSILENCQVICKTCDDLKTYGDDIPAIAKSDRKRDRHIGAKPKSRRGFRGWRNFRGERVWRKS